MSLFFIATLILFGITLVILEIVMVPGLIVGIIGGTIILLGIFWSWQVYGERGGIIIAIVTLLLLGITLFLALKTKFWQRFSLTNTSSGRVNELESGAVLPGDEGYAVSSLRPMGTIKINGRKFEAGTDGELIPPNYPIIVIRVEPGKIIVEPKKKNS